MMDAWVLEAMANNILITGEVLHQKWTKFVDLAGIPENNHLKLSKGWLSWYKAQIDLKKYKYYGEAASASLEMAEAE
jgi:hypothetical protein